MRFSCEIRLHNTLNDLYEPHDMIRMDESDSGYKRIEKYRRGFFPAVGVSRLFMTMMMSRIGYKNQPPAPQIENFSKTLSTSM